VKKVISVLTTTRADYGLLKPIIAKLNLVDSFEVRIVATGMHLSPLYGLTYQEIEQDGFIIDSKIKILEEDNSPVGISKAMGWAMIYFAEYFEKLNPDLILVLGDRFETLAVCCAAMNSRIPIAHLYGGETTEGAIDEAIRHSITKLSYLHFTSTEEYRNRVIQMGEAPNRVFKVGAIGIENIKNMKLLTKAELSEALDFSLDMEYAVVTFHPVTLEGDNVRDQFQELLNALDQFSGMKFILTKANADAYGATINELMELYARDHRNVAVYDSLGSLRYLSALKYCTMVIGNSSSGLLEAPSFGVPTINIGDRQKGRMQSDSVINCKAEAQDIAEAMRMAQSSEFREKARNTINPYGDGNTSDKIIGVLREYLENNKIELKKEFYNLNVSDRI